MSSPELSTDSAGQGDRRERMAVSAAGSEPSFQNLEECKESTARELREVRRENQRLRRKNRELKSINRQLQEEVERYEDREAKKRKADKEMEDSTSGCLELRFNGRIPDIIYTMDRVKAENTKDLCFKLFDTTTGKIVKSGPESSMKVRLYVLHGEFKGAETGNFSSKCFEKNILTRRKDDGPLLLRGDDSLNLNEGTAVFENLKITANSSWIPSGSFRLAARVTDGDFKGIRVKEAITNAFVVKEKRGKSDEKHDTPHRNDPVWRLKGIARNGAFKRRLAENGIRTVGEFLNALNENEDGLRYITGMRADAWDAVVARAKKCRSSGGRILTDISNLHGNHVYDVAQRKKVGEQQYHQVFGGSRSEQIDSIPGGSSKSKIQQQHIPPQAFAGSSDVGGKNVDASMASGDDALGDSSSGGTWNQEVFKQQQLQAWNGQYEGVVGSPANAPIDLAPQAFAASSDMGNMNMDYPIFSPEVPAIHVNPFCCQFQENHSLELGFDDTENGVGFCDSDHDQKSLPQRKEDLCNMTRNSIDTQGRVNVSSAACFLNISAKSTHKDERASKNYR